MDAKRLKSIITTPHSHQKLKFSISYEKSSKLLAPSLTSILRRSYNRKRNNQSQPCMNFYNHYANQQKKLLVSESPQPPHESIKFKFASINDINKLKILEVTLLSQEFRQSTIRPRYTAQINQSKNKISKEHLKTIATSHFIEPEAIKYIPVHKKLTKLQTRLKTNPIEHWKRRQIYSRKIDIQPLKKVNFTEQNVCDLRKWSTDSSVLHDS